MQDKITDNAIHIAENAVQTQNVLRRVKLLETGQLEIKTVMWKGIGASLLFGPVVTAVLVTLVLRMFA